MIFIILLLSVFLLDLMLRKYVEANLEEGKIHAVLNGKILVRKFHNNGIAFGKFADHQEEIEQGTFLMIFALLIHFLIQLRKKRNGVYKTGLALVLGGALCNWCDRFRQHTVTDYFSFNVKWKKLRDMVFNFSDFCILAGSVMTLFSKKQ